MNPIYGQPATIEVIASRVNRTVVVRVDDPSVDAFLDVPLLPCNVRALIADLQLALESIEAP